MSPQIVLAFGNYMNSSKRGAAYGFRLQSLDAVGSAQGHLEREGHGNLGWGWKDARTQLYGWKDTGFSCGDGGMQGPATGFGEAWGAALWMQGPAVGME